MKIPFVQKTFALGANPRNDANGQRIEEIFNHLRRDHSQTIRLLMPRGNLGDKLVGADTDGAAESLPLADLGLELRHLFRRSSEIVP